MRSSECTVKINKILFYLR